MVDFHKIKNEAKSLFDSGQMEQAAEQFLIANSLNENDLDVIISLGLSFAKLQNLDNAQLWLEKAEMLSGERGVDLPAICYMYLGSIHRSLSNTDKAIEYYQSAIASYPDFPAAHLLLAGLYMGNKELDDAEYHYNFAIKLQPNNADAFANLAQVYELSNKTGECRNAINHALELIDNHIGALMALAKLEKREKNYLTAANVLNKLIDKSDQNSITAMAYIELGQVLDKQKKFDDAFHASTKGKEKWAEEVANIPFDINEYKKRIISNKKYFSKKSVVVAKVGSSKYRSPIFFVGFPRSGTTLAEQILNQHPDIITSDEKTFIDVVKESIPLFTNADKFYPECLDGLTDVDISKLQEIYWDAVRHQMPYLKEESILVDKLPLNIIDLGLINKIFPDAHILVALRDPRDACLSGFMQSFTPNPAMINFLSMQSSVDFYSQVMGLWLHYRDVLPLNWHQYHYEDLVSDFDKTTRDIFKFLELEYPKNASDFHITAGTRTITTPSYQDVATPIYQRSKARWKNYEKHFYPYMNQLTPFLVEFNY